MRLPDGVHRTEQPGRFAGTAANTGEIGEALETLTGEMCRRSPSALTVSYGCKCPDDEQTVCSNRVD